MSSSSLPPLHTQNPQSRFSDRAADYASYRPSYPSAALDTLLAGLIDPDQLQIADIGAGTGISSRLLADRGATVWAIEPNAAMRDAAQPHPNLSLRSGTAEHTGLPDQSVDLITCFQSFHWFEPEAALREFHRILKPGGRVALSWNDRDRDDDFTNQYTNAIRQAVDPQFLERIDRKASDAEALRQSPLFRDYCAHRFSNSHPLSREGLVGLALSASYVPKSGQQHQQLVQDLQQLYDRYNQARLLYQTHLFLATRQD